MTNAKWHHVPARWVKHDYYHWNRKCSTPQHSALNPLLSDFKNGISVQQIHYTPGVIIIGKPWYWMLLDVDGSPDRHFKKDQRNI
jgi:hypothetical protein